MAVAEIVVRALLSNLGQPIRSGGALDGGTRLAPSVKALSAAIKATHASVRTLHCSRRVPGPGGTPDCPPSKDGATRVINRSKSVSRSRCPQNTTLLAWMLGMFAAGGRVRKNRRPMAQCVDRLVARAVVESDEPGTEEREGWTLVEKYAQAQSAVFTKSVQGAPARGIANGVALSLCFWIPLGLAIWSCEADATTTITTTFPLPGVQAGWVQPSAGELDRATHLPFVPAPRGASMPPATGSSSCVPACAESGRDPLELAVEPRR